jgi:hypothetical protein
MATTAEIDQALAVLRAERAKLAQLITDQDHAVLERDVAIATVVTLDARVIAAHDSVTVATAHLVTLLAEVEI